MSGIDAHQHFWKYSEAEYPWIQADWPIRRDFLPGDLRPLLRASGFDGCIAVQARQTIEESRWLLKLADEFSFIRGVVGWVDLQSPAVDAQLADLAEHPKFVGVRHVVQDELDDRFMLRPGFMRGIARLREHGLTWDFLVFPHQLPACVELARRFPEQPFVLDHIAKPAIRDGRIEPWRSLIQELAAEQNVCCKISGMVTEARWGEWTPADFRPYLDAVWQSFGEDRLMIGSDWPVCLLSADYSRATGFAREYLTQFSAAVREKVLSRNAARFYGVAEQC